MFESNSAPGRLPVRSLNHVSRLCRSVEESAAFYRDVLGFALIKRPESFDFDGAWLFSNALGIHLIKGEPLTRPGPINPRADHLSFQADNLDEVEERLQKSCIPYEKREVFESGIKVQQVFFHDPDGAMIECCNCDVLPIEFLALQAASSSGCVTCMPSQLLQQQQSIEAGEAASADHSCATSMDVSGSSCSYSSGISPGMGQQVAV